MDATHERFAHQDGIDPQLAQHFHIRRILDAALRNDDAVLRYAGHQLGGMPQIDRKRLQVPVVDADDLTARIQSFRHFRFIMHLNQHMQSQAFRQVVVALQPAGKNGRDQQDGIGPDCIRLVDLILIDDEIFSQHRLAADFPHVLNEGILPLEEVAFGQDGYRIDADVFIDAGDFPMVEVIQDDPF